jgi:hypothetical protein
MSSFKKFSEHLTLLKNIVSQRFLMRNLGLIILFFMKKSKKIYKRFLTKKTLKMKFINSSAIIVFSN